MRIGLLSKWELAKLKGKENGGKDQGTCRGNGRDKKEENEAKMRERDNLGKAEAEFLGIGMQKRMLVELGSWGCQIQKWRSLVFETIPFI